LTHITKISVKGFESHEDTVLDDLSPGLNAIVGISNSGKSSIVRALAFISYNQYDPKSLRNGCDNCEVEVTTTNGRVKVTRGKKNLWEVTDRTGKISHFDKIGKQILPQVSEVLGFGLVKLGDVEMKVNIMDQLESHFMLSEFDGEDATGSLRAQVVDEISGLSGIETLIREVGLDNNRLTRETNQIEERIKEITLQLHDEQALNHEEAVLKRAGDFLLKHDENLEVIAALGEIGKDHQNARTDVARLRVEQGSLPDEAQVLSIVETSLDDIAAVNAMTGSYTEWETTGKIASRLAKEMTTLPDDTLALEYSQQAQESLERSGRMATLSDSIVGEKNRVKALQDELAGMSDPEAVLSSLAIVEKVLGQQAEIVRFQAEHTRQAAEVASKKNEIAAVDKAEEQAAREYNEALSKVDVCPVTLKPISGECLKDSLAKVNA